MPTLRPFQAEDVKTLKAMPYALIGHQQGLGKTIITSQIIRVGTTIVCPSSVMLNWEKELRVWRPDLKTQVIRSSKEDLLPDTEVIIVSYGLLVRMADKLPACFTLVGDESHNLKNRQAKRSQVFAQFAKHADNVYLLSGTPMPNRTKELWTQLRILRATDMSFSAFTKRYSGAHQGHFGWFDDGATNLEELRDEIMSKVMVRRLKADVLKELPPVTHQIIEVEHPLTKKERDLAEAIREHGPDAILSIPFEEMSTYRRLTGERKMGDVIEHVRGLLESGEKVVLMAHHRDIIDNYCESLAEFNPVKITGDTSPDARQAAVDTFQEDDQCRLFVGNIIAAGVGITLTASSQVVLGEIDWVPGNLDQAIDRVHRIGQTEAVVAQYIVTRDGLDHRMLESLLEKADNINTVVQATA